MYGDFFFVCNFRYFESVVATSVPLFLPGEVRYSVYSVQPRLEVRPFDFRASMGFSQV